MGANATTFVPSYTSGEVLTAANLSVTNSGIPVFATTVTRDAAFGGTGEKTLAEGQFAYIEATNTTQYYDGAAWQPVGVAPGLVLVKSQTIGSAVASVTVTNAFSASYDAYKITVTGGASSVDLGFNLLMGATTAGYYAVYIYSSYSLTTVAGSNVNNGSAWSGVGSSTADGHRVNIELLNPFLAKKTSFNGSNQNQATNAGFVTGYLNNTTSYTDFKLELTSGTVTGGEIRVYGYANS